MVNLYELLGIKPIANTKTIQQAIIRAAEKRTLTLEQLSKIKSVLLDEKMRINYDFQLKKLHPEVFIEFTNTIEPIPNASVVNANLEKYPVSHFQYKHWQVALLGVICLLIGWFGGQYALKTKINKAVKETLSISNKADKPTATEDAGKKNTVVNEGTTSNNETSTIPKNWEYSSEKDEMRGIKVDFASVASLNVQNLGFPYENTLGGIKISSVEYADGKKIGPVYLFTTALVNCADKDLQYKGCVINVKFDDRPAEEVIVSKLENSSGVSVSVNEDGFIQSIRQSKKLIIELPMSQGGYKQFNFNVENFKW